MIRLWETRRRQGIRGSRRMVSARCVGGRRPAGTVEARTLFQPRPLDEIVNIPSDVDKIPSFQTDLAAGMRSLDRQWNALKSERTRENYSFLQLNRVHTKGRREVARLTRSIQGQLSRALRSGWTDAHARPFCKATPRRACKMPTKAATSVKERQERNSSRFAGRRLR